MPRFATATANRPSDRGGEPSISNIGLQLRENSLIVDQLAASIITLLAQLSGSRENARGSIGKHLPAWDEKAMEINRAGVPELVDGRNLKCLATPERSHLFWKTRSRFRHIPAGTKRDLENASGF
jgi:hypothetical protein